MRVRSTIAALLSPVPAIVSVLALPPTPAAARGPAPATPTAAPGPTLAVTTVAPGPAQVVTVRAAGPASTFAVVEAWSRTPAGSYRRVAGGWPARTGARGVGPTREGLARTPVGSWAFGTAFSVGAGDPGTAMPFFRVDVHDVWAGDPRHARSYNRHVRCAPYRCPFRLRGWSERLVNYPRAYRYAIDLGYNRRPVVPGRGSAFFLHVWTGGPTAGCVAVRAGHLRWLLRWLRPGAMVTVGVGRRAYALVPVRQV